MENSWLLLLAGALIGAFYMYLLSRTVKRIAKGKACMGRAVGAFYLRLSIVAVCLWLAAHFFEIEGVLFFLAGFLIVKSFIQRKVKKYGHNH